MAEQNESYRHFMQTTQAMLLLTIYIAQAKYLLLIYFNQSYKNWRLSVENGE